MNYDPNIINLNYGTSYISNSPNNSQGPFYLNISNDKINIDTNTGIITISENLDVGEYILIINDLTTFTVFIKQNIIYDLTNVSYNCQLIPILQPPLDIRKNNLFTFDISNSNIIIDNNNGIITCNNLSIDNYSFTVNWNLNSINSTYFINFLIKPEIYYKPDFKYITYGSNEFSDLPIIYPNENYNIKSNYNINLSGILDFSNYDVGYYKINVIFSVNNISVTTYYNLYVLPIITYLNTYSCNAFIEYKTDIPSVSQLGGQFSISGMLEYFNVNSSNGIITINAPTNIYNLIVVYTKNNVSNFTNLNLVVNPNISYDTIISNSNSIGYSNYPISNEIIDGIFSIEQSSNTVIDPNTGVIEFSYLDPNIYYINVNYMKNLCSTNTTLKLIINPVLSIITEPQIVNYGTSLKDVYFEIIPSHLDYKLICDNKNVEINNNYLILNKITDIGVYNIKLKLTINDQFIYDTYNFIIQPTISYNNVIGYYNQPCSGLPIINPPINDNKLFFTIDNLNTKTGIVNTNNLDVGHYNFNIRLKYLDFDISANYYLLIKPILSLPSQNIIYSNSISGLFYSPEGGLLTFNPDYNISSLDVGSYNYNISYTINNITETINVPFNIVKKELLLNLYNGNKIYDTTNNVKIISLDVSDIIIDGQFYDSNIGKNKNILINNIILPDYLINNYYVNDKKLLGEITPQIIVPIIYGYDKIYDGTKTAIISISSDLVNILSYNAYFNSISVGQQNITINNIVISDPNYVLSEDTYTISAFILPKTVYVTLNANDKIYDGTTSSVVVIENITGIIGRDNIFLSNIVCNFIDPNVGYNEITVTSYDMYNSNYNLVFNKIMANIIPQKVALQIIANTKVYDGTLNANVSFMSDLNVTSYNANYVDKNVSNKKLIKITDIVLENTNYKMDNTTLYGTISPKTINFDFSGNDKIYDGLSTCDGTYKIDPLPSDDVACTFNADFKNLFYGTNKDLIITNLKLIGTDALNYIVGSINTNTPTIYKKELIFTFKCIDKMYDKTTTAYLTIISVSGMVLSDNILNPQIISLDADYDNYYYGNNKKITVKNIILEPKLINYYSNNISCLGNILKRELKLNVNAITREFNNNTDAELNIININNIIHNDIVYIESYESNFVDPNVGSDKLINVTNIILIGDSANNYICNDFKITGSIEQKYLIINFKALDQEYDPNLVPILTYTLDDNLLDVSSYNASYLTIAIGKQKILISDIILSGLNANNYVVAEQIIYGNITQKKIDFKFKAEDKFYDSTTNVKITYDTQYSITFNSKFEDPNIGYKKVFITDISLNNITNNYIYDNNAITYANIYPAKIIINPNIYKVYDTTNIGYIRDLTTPIGGVDISSYNCLYSSSNVGINIPVTINNIILNNNNYFINNFNTIGTITPLIINATIKIEDKIYDGNNSVNIIEFNPEFSTIISYNAYYINVNVGLNQVNIENIKLADNNYKINNIITFASILPKRLYIDFVVKPKIYDNNKSAIIDSYTILNSTETIKIISYVAIYLDTSVGNQEIIITNVVIDTLNYYTIAYYTYSMIYPAQLQITFTNLNKYYDKTINTQVEIGSINGILPNDNVNVSYFNSSYEDYKVGNNIVINSITLTDNRNYTIKNYNLYGNILPKEIDASFIYINNIIVGSLIGIINSDDVTIDNYISYQQNGDTYIQNITFKGNDKNNYVLKNNNYLVSK
jgi:hypothetical protein